MTGLRASIELLEQITKYYSLASSTTITGLKLLDVPITKGKVHIKFECPCEGFPEYNFTVEFRVSKAYFENKLKDLFFNHV